MKHVLVVGVCQKGSPLLAGLQAFGMKWQAAKLSDEFADIQTPMRVEIVQDPMELLLLGERGRHVVQMCGEIDAGASLAQVPDDFASGHHEGGDQTAGAVTNVFVLAFFGFAGLGIYRGILSLLSLIHIYEPSAMAVPTIRVLDGGK